MTNKSLTIIAVIFLLIFFILILFVGILGMERPFPSFQDAVAVVEVSGLIRDSREIIRQIKKFSREPSVKAIVVRIESPGGVVAPTQEIFEQIKEVRRKGKKVVASMGSIATSGGLYIALASDKIVANPGTITGSIGVVMNFPILEKLLQKLGIGFETIKSEKYKDIGSPFRPMKSEERALLKGVVDDVYQEFLTRVAEERSIPLERVKEISDGRIFSGKKAKEFGLVDTLGGLETAIKVACQITGIKGEPRIIREKKIFALQLLLNKVWLKFMTPNLLYLPY